MQNRQPRFVGWIEAFGRDLAQRILADLLQVLAIDIEKNTYRRSNRRARWPEVAMAQALAQHSLDGKSASVSHTVDPLQATTPEDLIGHGGDSAHVNPAEHKRAAFFDLPQRGWYQLAYRSEDDRGIGRSGGLLVRAPDPFAGERPSECLRLRVAWSCEGEHPLSLVAGNLRHNMRSRAEPVEPEAFAWTGRLERTIADQPRAQQRCGVGIIVTRWKEKAVAGIGERMRGETAIDLKASYLASSHKFSRPERQKRQVPHV